MRSSGSAEFRVPTRLKGEGRVLVILACGLAGFAAYFVVGVVRDRLTSVHLAIAVLSVLVAGLTIWSQQRRPVLLWATLDRLVVTSGTYAEYWWADVEHIRLADRDGRSALVIALADRPEPAVVRLEQSALPPVEVLHGIRKVAPDHIALLPP